MTPRRVSWKRFEADPHLPCPGCGEEMWDGRGPVPPLNDRTPEQTAMYAEMETRYRERHGECHASRWSISGSWQEHCSRCCPPPPISPSALRHVADILRSS